MSHVDRIPPVTAGRLSPEAEGEIHGMTRLSDWVRIAAAPEVGPCSAHATDSAVEAVVRGYQRRLRDSGSRIPLDPRAYDQLQEQAGGVVRDVLAGLNGQSHLGDGHHLSDEIGIERALAGLHPQESLDAAALLFEEALSVVAQDDAAPDAATVRRIAVLLHHAILDRIATASVSYAGFLLTRAREAHIEERSRVARELHDHAAHDVATALQRIELARVHTGDDEREELVLAAGQLRQALENIRTMSTELRDSVHVHGGFRAALVEYLRGHARPGVSITLSVQGNLDRLAPEVTEEVYLTVREAIRNSLAHSESAVLHIEVDLGAELLVAVIRDQGRGFDPASDIGDANGLTSIRERCALLGGRSLVTSTVGVGTTIEIRVPVGAA